MGLPRATGGLIVPVIALILVAWIVQLGGLFYLQKSCQGHNHLSPWWAALTGAGLPGAGSCLKVYRYHWWSVWFEFPLVLGIIASLAGWAGGYNVLQRYRMSWIGLLATCTTLQMWSANVMLNLTDTFIRKSETQDEGTRAHVAFYGFMALSALNLLLIFILGDDGPSAVSHSGESLLGGEA